MASRCVDNLSSGSINNEIVVICAVTV